MHVRSAVKIGAVLLLAGAMSGCGGQSGLSGEYGKSEAGQWFTVLDFQGGDRVTVSMIGSADRFNGTYTREGDRVVLTAAGETRTLRIDDKGCLDGGPGNSFFSGVVCKKS